MAKLPSASQTAFGPMVIVACEQHVPKAKRLIDDPLAIAFLPAGLRLMVRACQWSLVRNLLMAATEKRAPGIWAIMACRKRYADDAVLEAVQSGVGAVVILGAGLDTRAYRLVAPAGIDTYEIDLPANIAYKQQRLHSLYGRTPEHVTLLSVDFDKDDLEAVLAKSGFRAGASAMFVWEGVTQYLTEDGVRRTLSFLSRAASGSRLVFTFIRKDFLDGANFYGAEQLCRQFVLGYRVWRFGMAPEAVGGFLEEYGWAVQEQVGALELAAEYVEPTARRLSVSEIERIVHAVKL